MSPSANGFRKCAQPRNAPSSSWRFPQFGTGDVVVLCVDCGGHHRSGCVEGRKVTVHFLQEICTKTPACHAGSGGRPHTYIRTALRPFEEIRHVFFLRPFSREAIYHPLLLLLWEHGRWPGSRTPTEPSRQVILF